MTSDAVGVVSRFAAFRHPTADVVILAGSRARGQPRNGSDHDVILLFEALPSGAWREMTLFEGHYIEVFAHDLATLTYFLQRIDRPSANPALLTMIREGVVAVARSPALLEAARGIAAQTLALGPEPLDENTLQAGRFAISELAAALQADRGTHVLLAVAASLHAKLADFALRAGGYWSASGKALPHALAAMDPALESRFEMAFTALLAAGDALAVQLLVDAVLAPYGGRLREGFRQSAPAEWRS